MIPQHSERLRAAAETWLTWCRASRQTSRRWCWPTTSSQSPWRAPTPSWARRSTSPPRSSQVRLLCLPLLHLQDSGAHQEQAAVSCSSPAVALHLPLARIDSFVSTEECLAPEVITGAPALAAVVSVPQSCKSKQAGVTHCTACSAPSTTCVSAVHPTGIGCEPCETGCAVSHASASVQSRLQQQQPRMAV